VGVGLLPQTLSIAASIAGGHALRPNPIGLPFRSRRAQPDIPPFNTMQP
jgi:hypothetical protein